MQTWDAQRVKKHIDGLVKLSDEQVKHRILEGQFITLIDVPIQLLHELYGQDIQLPNIVDGWKLRVTKPTPRENLVNIFIVSNSDKNYPYWYRGQLVVAHLNGLSNYQAKQWIRSRSKYKHVLLANLADALKDDHVLNGYLNYDQTFTDSQFRAWRRQYGIYDGLSPTMRGKLVYLIKQVSKPPAS